MKVHVYSENIKIADNNNHIIDDEVHQQHKRIKSKWHPSGEEHFHSLQASPYSYSSS